MIACALAFGGAGQDCGGCDQLSEADRQLKGCGVDGPDGIYTFDRCYVCGTGHAGCHVCDGSGRWSINRCPGSLDLGNASEIVWLANLGRESGLWPVDGGLLNQRAMFREALVRITAEQSRYESAAKGEAGG